MIPPIRTQYGAWNAKTDDMVNDIENTIASAAVRIADSHNVTQAAPTKPMADALTPRKTFLKMTLLRIAPKMVLRQILG